MKHLQRSVLKISSLLFLSKNGGKMAASVPWMRLHSEPLQNGSELLFSHSWIQPSCRGSSNPVFTVYTPSLVFCFCTA